MKRVLILCTGNSARSQMAEGLLRHFAGDRFEVFSAGVKPAQVNPLAIAAMKAIGIDISKYKSKSVAGFSGQQFDYVITVCDNVKQTCPVFPGEYQRIHWGLEDPAQARGTEGEKLNVFREIRDKIKENIAGFLGFSEISPFCRSVKPK